MTKKFQAVRGMYDILPEQAPLWVGVEKAVREMFTAYGYREMRIPIVESTDLFKRSIGEVTDIVEKEMFSFADRDGDSLTLRPEATAGFVRACIENGLLHNQTQRIWCIGPMFRYEKPQRGRYRQFQQIDVEAFGLPGPDIDAELICMTAHLWQSLGLQDISLQINSLATSEVRAVYRKALIAYFESHRNELDTDSLNRLHRNPLRILDSKNPAMAELVAAAPVLADYLDDDSIQHFTRLKRFLRAAGLDFEVNPRLVRGLDYYNMTVFEWVTGSLGAQNAVCGGGRYDGLVEHLGGRATPGIGFAIGMDRLVELLAHAEQLRYRDQPHVYLVTFGDMAQEYGFALAERLRAKVAGLRIILHCGGGSFKSQFKRADQSKARFALILGDEEIQAGRISVKDLRTDSKQMVMSEDDLFAFLSAGIEKVCLEKSGEA